MLLLVITNICFAVAIVGNKYLLFNVSPLLHVAIRMGIPGSMIFIKHLVRGTGDLTYRIMKNGKILLGMMLFTTLLPLFLKNFALQKLPSGKFAFLGSMDPFVAAFWGWVILGETFVWQQLIAVLIAIFGVFLVLLDKTPLEECLSYLGIFSLADLAMIIAVFLSKLGWVFTCQLLRDRKFEPGEINSVVMTGAGICALILVFFSGSWIALPSVFNPKFLSLLAFVLTINTLGYYLFTASLQRYSFTMVSIAGCSISVMVAIMGAVLWQERISYLCVLAVILNIVAIKMFSASKSKI